MDGGRTDMARVIDVEIVGGEPRADESTVLRDDAAERATIAAVFLDEHDAQGVWQRLSPILGAGHFADPKHATIWRAIVAVRERGEAVDFVSVSAELRARRCLNAIGGPQYLDELTEQLPTLAHCETHARLVIAAAARRALVAIGEHLARAAADGARDPMHLRELAVEALRQVHLGAPQASGADDLVTAMWQAIEDGIAGKGRGPLPFGVPTLDRMSDGGMKRGGSYFIASRPGIGKTTLVCQVSGAAAESGERVLYVALEPSRLEVIQTITANRAGVALTKITRAHRLLSQDDMDAIAGVANRLATWPLHVVDATERSCPDTVAKIEAAMRSLPSMPSLVVVDHLLKVNAAGRYGKGHEGTAEVVAALVSLGKRTGATILTLCHVGRGVSSSNSALYRRPRPEDVAGGDAMNRDADGIILLHREDKYPTKRENVGNPRVAGVVDMLAPKLRGVADNTAGRMVFRGDVQRFEGFAAEPSIPQGDVDA